MFMLMKLNIKKHNSLNISSDVLTRLKAYAINNIYIYATLFNAAPRHVFREGVHL